MKQNHITFEEYFDTLKVNHHGIETALKVLDSVHGPVPFQKGKLGLNLVSKYAEDSFRHSAAIGRTTSGLSANQFLLTLAEQNTVNAALLLLNVSISKTIFEAIENLQTLTAFNTLK